MSEQNARSDHRAVFNGADDLSVLTFTLNGETFAIEATIVQEILDLLPETSVPGSLPFVGSVINFRGKVIRWPTFASPLAWRPETSRSTAGSSLRNSISTGNSP